MRDIVTAKWSLRPQRLVLGVVLIGMLLLAPQQCRGDDEPVTPTASSQSQPAQQSPPGGPAEPGTSSAVTQNSVSPPPPGNAVARSSGQFGSCNYCFRDPDLVGNPSSPPKECLDDESNWTDEECAEEEDKKVRCFTALAFHRGPANSDKNKKSAAERVKKNVQIKGCHKRMSQYGTSLVNNMTVCAQDKLNLKLKDDGKCVKGNYTIDSLTSFYGCFSESYHGSFTIDDPTKFESTKAENEGYFGKMGGVKYAEIWMCLCKGEKCNKHKKKEIGAATQASATSPFKSFASTSMITFTLIVAPASFLHLP